MKIINVPIEPLEERYSRQWAKWFKDAFAVEFANVHTIYGKKTSGKITVGSFLDVFETNQYKLSQLQSIIKILKETPTDEQIVLFFHDLWFLGLETIAYIRDGAGFANLKICGCLHAGTYDPFDFLTKKGMVSWGKSLEESWFAFIDKIFVATSFHKKLIADNRYLDVSKIEVTGFPIFAQKTAAVPKENIVVFPHRLDSEKHPELFDRLAVDAAASGWQFIKTKEVCKTKEEYYNLLARSKIAISFADQETWGIAMQEAVFAGCVSLVPNRLSYVEMYHPIERHYSYENCVDKVLRCIDALPAYRHFTYATSVTLLRRGAAAIPNIIKEIKKL